MKNYINKIKCHVQYNSRKNKLNQFIALLELKESDKVLEVGVTDSGYSPADNFLIKNFPFSKKNITALGIGELVKFRRDNPEIKTVGYDGGKFPFTDGEFDAVHSNAVIEHVGAFEAQEFFLKEMIRVSRRGMITTPNRMFPIELHTMVPFVHWMGKGFFDRFLKSIGKEWFTGDRLHLLRYRDLELLIKKTKVKNFSIIRNRLLGLTITFSLIWSDGK